MTAAAWTTNQRGCNAAKILPKSCNATSQKSEIKKGTKVKVVDDYDLFDFNINGSSGIYIKQTTTGKFLIYIPETGEWAELSEEQFVPSRGPIPKKNLEFISRVKTMVYTLET